jgi:DNA-binding beta-propeller fold protein YncE
MSEKNWTPFNPPAKSSFRQETGYHTQGITAAALDSTQRYLVTASLDKTVRVWDPTTGKLIRTIRPPLGEGLEGGILAVGISPDGKTIACGGRTGVRSREITESRLFAGPTDDTGHQESRSEKYQRTQYSYFVYVFDRDTGNMIHNIAVQHYGPMYSGEIYRVDYSHDGKLLVVGSRSLPNGTEAYTIFRSSDYERVGGGSSAFGDWDRLGRMAIFQGDNRLSILDSTAKVLATREMSTTHSTAVAFSPDDLKVALLFQDSTVAVLSAKDLSLVSVHHPSETGHQISGIAWSASGEYLIGRGQYCHEGMPCLYLFRWGNGGTAPLEDLQVPNPIRHIIPLKHDGFYALSSDSSLGVIGEGPSMYKGPLVKENLLNKATGLQVSKDGSTVWMTFENDSRPLKYSVYKRILEEDPSTQPISRSFRDESSVQNTLRPFLKSSRRDEMITTVTYSENERHVLIGSNFGLYFYTSCCKQEGLKWRITLDASARHIIMSGNRRLAVAALEDGTVRWFRLSDGKELLALYASTHKHWTLWTPSGYYDASAGAENLLGRHKNYGWDEGAEFFTIASFRKVLYRPDILAKLFDTWDEEEAIRYANATSGRSNDGNDPDITPPIVRILSPLDGEEVSKKEVTLTYTVETSESNPIKEIKTFIDGRPISVIRGVNVVTNQRNDGTLIHQQTVILPPQDSKIAILALNSGAVSEPAIVSLKWRGGPPPREFAIQPKLYILSVGVSQYVTQDLSLAFAAKDARDFVSAMKAQQGGLYRDIVIRQLTDREASKNTILDGLEWIRTETTSKDVAMIFFAGHGINDQAGTYYFLPSTVDTEKLLSTAVSLDDIRNTIQTIAGKALFFIDTCHAGNIMPRRSRGLADIVQVINELTSAENGAVVFAASTGTQSSLEDDAWRNGAFTKALVEGLNGKAAYTGDGKISVNMLDLYLSERVKELTKGQQTPTTTKPHTIPDFPIALTRTSQKTRGMTSDRLASSATGN